MQEYLRSTEIIDWQHPSVLEQALELSNNLDNPVEIAKNCFEWVRDEIYHSSDFQMNPVTLKASEVLENKTGFCYAKSHLLAAFLRANRIPSGLCYQRLSQDENLSLFCLHGLTAVFSQRQDGIELTRGVTEKILMHNLTRRLSVLLLLLNQKVKRICRKYGQTRCRLL